MARSGVSAVSIALVFAAVGCDQRPHEASHASVTMKLPPARPAAPAPAFSFNADKARVANETE